MTKALVLTGGGTVGVAWETGVIVGLARGGVDVRDANLIFGTSAGAIVGSRLALTRNLETLVALVRDSTTKQVKGSLTARSLTASDKRIADLSSVISQTPTLDETPEQRRAAFGRFALEAKALPEELILASFEDLRDEIWPDAFACSAIDAISGECVVWNVVSNVPLERAVASSCCVPGLHTPITINGRRYFDGGFRSPSNADLVSGYDRVLVISLVNATAKITLRPALAIQFETEVFALRRNGSQVKTIEADEASVASMGANLMERAFAPNALIEGLRQGIDAADQLASFWSGRY